MKKVYVLFVVIVFGTTVYAVDDICLERLKANTCLVNQEYNPAEEASVVEKIKGLQNQTCRENTSEYSKKLVEIYKTLPEHTKEAFCYIKKIYIVPGDVPYGGAAQLSYDLSQTEFTKNADGQEMIGLRPDGFILLLSKKYRFDIQETSAEYSSRILQQNFGINVRENGLDPALPYVKIESYDASFTPSSLYGTLVHEIGHFLDFSNQHTHTWNHISSSMSIESSSWSRLSWYMDSSSDWPFPNVSLDLLERPYKQDSATNYISLLEQSAFSSFYALAAPPEDFAEHYLNSVLGGEFGIWQNGVKLLSNANRSSTIYNKKSEYILQNLSPGFINFQNLPVEWRLKKNRIKASELCRHPR